MKNTQIDIFSTRTQEYIDRLGFKNKFLRLWGHDDTVLTERHYYYPSISENDIKLFKLLGIYTDLKDAQGKMSGITSAWIYLNPAKLDTSMLDTAVIIQKLEFQVTEGLYTLNIYPNISTYRVGNNTLSASTPVQGDVLGLFDESYLNPDGTISSTLTDYIKNNYSKVLSNYIVECTADDPIETLVAMNIMNGSDAFKYTVSSIEYGFAEDIKIVRDSSYKYSKKSLSLDLKITQIGVVTETDPLVVLIVDQVRAHRATAAAALINVTSAKLTFGAYNAGVKNSRKVSDAIWLNNRLRKSAFSASVLKTDKLIEVIQKSLDSGYQKKKVKWYKKLIGLIVFVVVFYFTRNAALANGASALVATAAALSIGTLAVSLLSAGMAAWGDEAGARWNGEFARKVGIVSSIIGFAALVQSISNAVAKAATQQVLAEAAKQGTELTATELASQVAQRSLLDTLKGMIVDYFKSGLVTNLSLEQGVSAASRVFGLYSKNKLEDLQDRLKTVQQQNAEYAQYEEENRSRDIGLALIKANGEMLHQDSTDKYDYMYESWHSPLHSGNVQRTSWRWERTGAKI